jgi:hypothetical protein
LTNADTETRIRFPYAIYGTLAVLLIFLVTKEAYGAVAGLAAASVLTFMRIHLEYSQEVRFYALSVVFALLVTWLFLRAIKKPSWPMWVLWGLSVLAGIYTAYAIAFVLVAQALYLLMVVVIERNKWRSHLLPAAVVGIAVAALFTPWLWWDMRYDSFNNGTAVTTVEAAWNQLVISNYSLRWVRILLVTTVLGAFFKREGWLWLGSSVAVFLGAVAINNLSGYFLHDRQLLLVWPFLVIGMIGAPVAIAKRLGSSSVGAVVAVVLCTLLVWQTLPSLEQFYTERSKPNWKGALPALEDMLQENDLVVYLAANDRRETVYYVRKAVPSARIMHYTVAMELPQGGNVWAIGTNRRQRDVSQEVLVDLAKYGFTKVQLGNIYISQLHVNVEAMKPIDPATLPAGVVLDDVNLKVTNGWRVRGDHVATGTVEENRLWLKVQPELRARAVFTWPGPLDLSQHHKGNLRAEIPPGCAVSLETVTEDGGSQRPVAGWGPGALGEIEFAVAGSRLQYLYLLLDATDASITECAVTIESIEFRLDERFTP